MRTFVGLSVPEPWVTPLMRASAALPGGRAVDADDLHVTLAFLDDQSEAVLEALHESLETRALPAPTLRPAGLAVLGTKPRAVVLDLVPDPALTQLREAVRSAARGAGIELSRERFRPHVTLLRYGSTRPADPIRLPRALSGIGMPEVAPAPVRLATLWSSTLTPDGPLYEPLATYPLGV
ncbi:RNA 2',3'-cyclic phosphodiesterase [uncultured Jannaschia sp.]|uniref:RNA 2',3'-cyclic phosphodiesterase n=1 Tax=uncultured Jannaschia sp. TaxID=293347 RepID=UPI00262B3DD4|nr:RNA 2',3'-cyclic phosphodiesterase [uncultured Jannaschia sp.]